MTKEALKLALEAFENIKNDPFKFDLKDDIDNAITAIKEALANEALEKMAENARELGLDYEPAQEPLGFMNAGHVHEMQQGRLPYGYVYPNGGAGAGVAVYTTPPQRKPLTDEEIETYRYMIDWTAHWSYIKFARAIEAAHGIKGEA
jgi:hypothetical protein